jgi:hypothetical protein
MSRIRSLAITTLALVVSTGAASSPARAQASAFKTATKSSVAAAAKRRYGTSVKLGDGTARSYVTLDPNTGAPAEIGVALSEKALEGLPSGGSGHHGMPGMVTHEFILSMPEGNGTPFKFVELNWNPLGHEPEGVYQDVPHFDFHFYTISKAERDAIVPTDSAFERKANDIPTGDYVPAYSVPLGPPGAPPAKLAVPKMGVHWSDVRSAELQKLLGKPELYKPFTATFIHGSWNGQFHFWEPMITRAHILEKKSTTDPAVRDQVIPISVPGKYKTAGYYPAAYRITWDAAAKEYRVALTQLGLRK